MSAQAQRGQPPSLRIKHSLDLHQPHLLMQHVSKNELRVSTQLLVILCFCIVKLIQTKTGNRIYYWITLNDETDEKMYQGIHGAEYHELRLERRKRLWNPPLMQPGRKQKTLLCHCSILCTRCQTLRQYCGFLHEGHFIFQWYIIKALKT